MHPFPAHHTPKSERTISIPVSRFILNLPLSYTILGFQSSKCRDLGSELVPSTLQFSHILIDNLKPITMHHLRKYTLPPMQWPNAK